jgi:hypothetical protein
MTIPRQFSIRPPRPLWIGMVVVVFVVVAVGLWIGVPFNRKLSAVKAILSRGGSIGTVRQLSKRQRQWIGFPTYKAFEEVEFVNWERSPINDADLDQLVGLPTLRRLNLWQTRVTDLGIACLKRLPRLELLLVEGTDVTDPGIADLKEALPGLTVER